MEKIKALLRDRMRMRELIAYVFFGALTTAVNWAAYLLVTRLLGMEMHEAGSAAYVLLGNIASVIAWVLSVLFAFFTNKKYVFQSKATAENGAWREFALFVSARVLSYALFNLLLYTALLYVMPHKWDYLLMNVLVVLFNYGASRFVIFKRKKENP